MSTFDSNELFDNKIYLVYWLWLKMIKSEILDMTVVQSEMLQGANNRKQNELINLYHSKKAVNYFRLIVHFPRHGTVLIEICGV